jgi:hypothetical protein
MGMGDSFPLPPSLAAILDDLPLDELAFDPVPVKPRRDGWTPARQLAFIHRLALIGCVASAARAVGMSRESAYRLLEKSGSESFAAAWEKALRWGRSTASDLGIERAIVGERRGVYYRGRKIDEQVRFDNRLLLSALNRLPAGEWGPAPTNEEFGRLVDEIDPSAAGKDFLRDSA